MCIAECVKFGFRLDKKTDRFLSVLRVNRLDLPMIVYLLVSEMCQCHFINVSDHQFVTGILQWHAHAHINEYQQTNRQTERENERINTKTTVQISE